MRARQNGTESEQRKKKALAKAKAKKTLRHITKSFLHYPVCGLK